MECIMFSIIVVALNPGKKLQQTIDSVLQQRYGAYEILIKDGGSTDGSVEGLSYDIDDTRIKLCREKDKGIYDAMNQAVNKVSGKYVLFLNCGDTLYDSTVLGKAAKVIEAEKTPFNTVFYGNTFCQQTESVVYAAPEITGFTCYRNIPCHQSCFYSRELLKERPYDLKYPVRADYDHFLWCFYVNKTRMIHLPITLASYEGGGFSESPENRKQDKLEHQQITQRYMGKGEILRYKALLALTLVWLRRYIAEKSPLSGIYHKTKELLYKR